MKAQIFDPNTNENVEFDLRSEDEEKVREKLEPLTHKKKLDNYIENLNIPAEAKVIIHKITEITISVGSTILRIGNKIIETIIYFTKKFPNTTIGVIVGSIIGLLFSSIPILGLILGPMLKFLCPALGLTFGFWEDLREKSLKSEMYNHIDEVYGELKKQPATSS